MIYYELITKKNKSKHHSSPRGLLIGSMYYPAYIGSHDTKLEIYIFQKITLYIQQMSCVCRSFAQLPGQNSYCLRTIMVWKELGASILLASYVLYIQGVLISFCVQRSPRAHTCRLQLVLRPF